MLRKIGTLMLLAVGLSACSDALVGTWTLNPIPAEFQAAGVTLVQYVFASGGKATSTVTETDPSTSSTDPTAGCVSTTVLDGTYVDSVSGDKHNVTFTYTSGTSAISGCQNSAIDQTSMPLGASALQSSQQTSPATATWVISGNSATVSTTVAGTAETLTFTN